MTSKSGTTQFVSVLSASILVSLLGCAAAFAYLQFVIEPGVVRATEELMNIEARCARVLEARQMDCAQFDVSTDWSSNQSSDSQVTAEFRELALAYQNAKLSQKETQRTKYQSFLIAEIALGLSIAFAILLLVSWQRWRRAALEGASAPRKYQSGQRVQK